MRLTPAFVRTCAIWAFTLSSLVLTIDAASARDKIRPRNRPRRMEAPNPHPTSNTNVPGMSPTLAPELEVAPGKAGPNPEAGFVAIFDGKSSEGWEKTVTVKDGMLEGDGCYLKKKYGNFVLRFEFKLDPAANSGMGIRTIQGKDAAYNGMEIQILDDGDAKYAAIHPWQHAGSVYGVVPAKTGFLKPLGEWNSEEIIASGEHIQVILNGEVIVDANIAEASKDGTIDGKDHPGLKNTDGYLRLCGHGGGVQFRNLRIKELQ
jgi:hypothetical protein